MPEVVGVRLKNKSIIFNGRAEKMIYKFFHKFNKIIIPLSIFAFFFTSCTSYKIVNKNEMTFYNYAKRTFRLNSKAGDKIRVTQSDGQRFKLIYIDITDEFLIAEYRNQGFVSNLIKFDTPPEELRIPLDQIFKIEKAQFSGSKTAGLIIGVPLALFIYILIGVIRYK